MGGDDYVIDEKRGQAWGNQYDALVWYREQLDRVEAERDDLQRTLSSRDRREG